MALGLVYFYHYKVGDTILYHEDGALLADIARSDFGNYLKILVSSPATFENWPPLQMQEPRAIILVKAVSLIHLLSFSNYWVTGLYFSFFSFLGAWFLVQQLSSNFKGYTAAAIVAFLFLPSVVFWSSGLIKESIAMASLFFLTAIFLKVWFSERVAAFHWLIVPVAVWLLWNLKYYFAAIFFVVIATSILFKFIYPRLSNSSNLGREFIIWMGLLVIPSMLISLMHPNFYPHRFFSVVVENNKAFTAISDQGDYVKFNDIQPHLASMLANAPWAWVTGLLRPFVWEAGNGLQFVASLENLLLLGLIFIALSDFRSFALSPYRMLVLSLFVYVSLLSIFIALSTPNFGTLSRYRASYIPFFFFILCCSRPVLTILQRSFNRFLPIKR
mgnify:CR=1 FL=1